MWGVCPAAGEGWQQGRCHEKGTQQLWLWSQQGECLGKELHLLIPEGTVDTAPG